MVKHRFSLLTRVALWRAYDQRCFYCENPLEYKDLQIDHVLPESLLGSPHKWQQISEEYGLNSDFLINSYDNWVPTHGWCNRKKGDDPQPRSRTMFFLGLIEKKKVAIKRIERELQHKGKNEHLLHSIGVRIEQGLLDRDKVLNLLHELERVMDPLVVCFGLSTDDVISDSEAPSDLPLYYADLCDYLEEQLIRQIGALVSCSFSYTEASQRTGETLSVRMAFWNLDLDELDRFSSPWWQILEVDYFTNIYGESALEYYNAPDTPNHVGGM